jgi:hypothetical protein
MTDSNGNEVRMDEVKLIVDLQERIGRKLNDLRYADSESAGNIVHHLAEVAVLGNKLFTVSVPKLLALPAERSPELADIAVEIQHDLSEMKEAIDDIELQLIKFVNFLNR